MLNRWVPWSLRGVNPFLKTYGDSFLFRAVRRTPPIPVDPDAEVSIHSAVPHKYVNAYLLAIKSFLMHYSAVAVYIHDDGSLNAADKDLLQAHLPGAVVVARAQADECFRRAADDAFLERVRSSYTSYIKLFDPSLLSNQKRIMILDTDTLFLRRPDAVIDWIRNGGPAWYHMAPRGSMRKGPPPASPPETTGGDHIQTRILREIDGINSNLGTRYWLQQGFCSGFIGYDKSAVNLDALSVLFKELFERFGDRIFKWGAEQTVHGLLLCSQGAVALPVQDYFVFTQRNAASARTGTFVHFVGENRFYRMIYPRLASSVVRNLHRVALQA